MHGHRAIAQTRPRRGNQPAAGQSGSASTALSGYAGLLPPLIPAGIVPAAVPVATTLVTPQVCLALYEAGWNAVQARDGLTPESWLVNSLRHYLPQYLDPDKRGEGEIELVVSVDNVGYEDDRGCQVAFEGQCKYGLSKHPIEPLFRHMEDRVPGLGRELLRALADSEWLFTPIAAFESISNLYWEGEDDERSRLVEEGDDAYSGWRRADLDAVYPMELIAPRQRPPRSARNKEFSGSRFRDLLGHKDPLVAAFAREALVLAAENASAPAWRNALADLSELGFDDYFPYAAIVPWSDHDEITGNIGDEVYQYASQCTSTASNTILTVPQEPTVANAKEWILAVRYVARRCGAVSRIFSLLSEVHHAN